MLIACVHCACHVLAHEAVCPHCGGALGADARTAKKLAIAAALGLSFVVGGCEEEPRDAYGWPGGGNGGETSSSTSSGGDGGAGGAGQGGASQGGGGAGGAGQGGASQGGGGAGQGGGGAGQGGTGGQ